jgi:hypothetical protein
MITSDIFCNFLFGVFLIGEDLIADPAIRFKNKEQHAGLRLKYLPQLIFCLEVD